MTVAELQKLLRALSETLVVSGAKGVAEELQEVNFRLQPFANLKVKAFAQKLHDVHQALEQGWKPGQASGAAKTSTPRASQAKVDAAELEARFKHYYDNAIQDEVTEELVQSAMRDAEALTKRVLEEMALRLGIVGKFKTKGELVKFIGKRIMDRKGIHARSQIFS